jgi:hypothetical protein
MGVRPGRSPQSRRAVGVGAPGFFRGEVPAHCPTDRRAPKPPSDRRIMTSITSMTSHRHGFAEAMASGRSRWRRSGGDEAAIRPGPQARMEAMEAMEAIILGPSSDG